MASMGSVVLASIVVLSDLIYVDSLYLQPTRLIRAPIQSRPHVSVLSSQSCPRLGVLVAAMIRVWGVSVDKFSVTAMEMKPDLSHASMTTCEGCLACA